MQEITGLSAYAPIRASTVLTNAFVIGTVLTNQQRFNEVVFYCFFTLGSLTSLDIKIESSIDGTNWVQETNASITGGTTTLNKGIFNTTETGNFKISMPMTARQVRVSANGNGTVTNSLLQIDSMSMYV